MYNRTIYLRIFLFAKYMGRRLCISLSEIMWQIGYLIPFIIKGWRPIFFWKVLVNKYLKTLMFDYFFLQIWAKISAQCNLWELTKINYHKVDLNVYQIRCYGWYLLQRNIKKYEERKRIWCFLHSVDTKGCLISEGILSLVPLPTKGTLSTLAKTEIIYPKSVGA